VGTEPRIELSESSRNVRRLSADRLDGRVRVEILLEARDKDLRLFNELRLTKKLFGNLATLLSSEKEVRAVRALKSLGNWVTLFWSKEMRTSLLSLVIHEGMEAIEFAFSSNLDNADNIWIQEGMTARPVEESWSELNPKTDISLGIVPPTGFAATLRRVNALNLEISSGRLVKLFCSIFNDFNESRNLIVEGRVPEKEFWLKVKEVRVPIKLMFGRPPTIRLLLKSRAIIEDRVLMVEGRDPEREPDLSSSRVKRVKSPIEEGIVPERLAREIAVIAPEEQVTPLQGLHLFATPAQVHEGFRLLTEEIKSQRNESSSDE
jgi:hypothetical protein